MHDQTTSGKTGRLWLSSRLQPAILCVLAVLLQFHVAAQVMVKGLGPINGIPEKATYPVPFDLKDPQPVYRTINAQNGLPSSETYDIHQDRAGYIWIATDRGVVRFDGYRYKVFTTKDGLADNVIFKLEEDHRGRIWFVSYSGLLSYAENGKIVPYKYNAKIKAVKGGLNPTFKTLRIDREDNLYYSIQDLGCIKITPGGVLTHIHPQSVVGITALQVEDKWIPSYRYFKRTSGSYLYPVPKRKNGYYVSYVPHNAKSHTQPALLATVAVNMAYGRSGVYMQMDDEVVDLKTGRALFKEVTATGIDCIGDQLFTGLFRRGVRIDDFSSPKAVRTQYLLPGYSVTSSMQDREGGYWFTTLENGVLYVPDLNVRSYTMAEGLPDLNILSIAGIADEVWVTYFTGQLRISKPYLIHDMKNYKMIPRVAATDHRFFFNTVQATGIADKGNLVYVLAHSDMYATSDHIVGARVRAYTTDESGSYTIFYDSYNYDHVDNIQNATTFSSIVETGEHRIFAGNLDGLFEIRNNHASATVFKDPVFRERVIDLEWHERLGVVVATRGQGIYFFDKNYRITRRIDRSNGLLSDQINALYIDKKGVLYVATSNGLNIIRFTKNGFTVTNLTTQQGLCSNEVNAMYAYSNKIWVATKGGLSVVNLAIPISSKGSTVKLEYLSTETAYHETGNLPASFAPLTELIKIGLRTDNFRGAEKHEFSYQFRKGGPWLKTAEPDITINNPADNDYAVSVRFRNDEGQWSAPVLVARFTVETPYYKTWYFITLIVIAGLLLIYVSFRVIVKRIKRRHHYETRINKLEQKALSAQMNPHFIFNSLNSIQSFLIYEENEKAEKYLLTFSSLIRQTLANSRDHYIRLEEELRILQNYLQLEQMRFREKFTYSLEVELGARELQFFLPPMLIQPYIENAVVHGVSSMEKGGEITVRFSLHSEDRLLVIIEDNGVGRRKSPDPDTGNHRSFGTTITQERFAIFKKQLGAEFHASTTDKLTDGKSAGTSVELIIPLLKTYESEEES